MSIKLTEEWADILVKAVEVVRDAFHTLSERISELIDEVKFLLNDISDHYGYPTSRSYKIVKYLSKLGHDKHAMWVVTRHTRLARSNC